MIENLPVDEILFIITQVRLVISNSTKNNFIGPDGINTRHLKPLHDETSLLPMDTHQGLCYSIK